MILRNRAAYLAWGFMLLWWAGVLGFTWTIWDDWPPPGHDPLWANLFLAFLWSSGLGCAALALRQSAVTLEVTPAGEVRLEHVGVLGRRRDVVQRREVAAVRIEQTEDGDGDPYYACWMLLRDGRRIAVAEGGHRRAVEAKAERLRAALRL